MPRVAYFDCPSGIAGDMTLAALMDCGVDAAVLSDGLRSLRLDPWELRVVEDSDHGIGGLHAEVAVSAESGHGRHLHHIEEIIGASEVPHRVKEQAIAVFRRLGEAEAAIHRVDIQQLHFHEVGAVDAIVDIVGACLLLDLLGVDTVTCSPLPMGRGQVECMHGVIPLPAPATVALTQGVRTYGVELEAELVTPTGAALMVTLAERFGPQPSMRVQKVGYGIGTRRFSDRPNVLRVMIGEADAIELGQVVVIETNIDDLSPQFYDIAMERLFEAGALDVYTSAIGMKKNRPGTLLTVLCPEDRVRSVTEVLFSETTTLGVRMFRCDRLCMERKTVSVATRYGTIRLKIASWEGGNPKVMPEYEDVKAAAMQFGVPARVISEHAIAAYRKMQEV